MGVSDILNLTAVRQQMEKGGKMSKKQREKQKRQQMLQQQREQEQMDQESGANNKGDLLRGFKPDEQKLIREAEDEKARSGSFKCIFPLGENAYQYKRFFEEARAANTVLANYYFCKTTGLVLACSDEDTNGLSKRELQQEQARHERNMRRQQQQGGGMGGTAVGGGTQHTGKMVSKLRDQTQRTTSRDRGGRRNRNG